MIDRVEHGELDGADTAPWAADRFLQRTSDSKQRREFVETDIGLPQDGSQRAAIELLVVGNDGKALEACSHRQYERVETVIRHWKAILLQGNNVALDGLFDVRYGLFAGFALGNAAGKAGALRYPVAVLPMRNDDLSQCRIPVDDG
jgi:hypothetical protein